MNLLNRLPDELLHRILQFVLWEEQPFWLEHCTELPRHRLKTDGDERSLSLLGDGVAGGNGVYPSRVVEQRLTTTVELSQAVHQQDWIIINSTCRRIRRLGKPLFFQTKDIAVKTSLPDKYKTRESWLDLTPEEKVLAWEANERRIHDDLTNPWMRSTEPRAGNDSNSDNPKLRHKLSGLSLEDQTLALAEMRHIILLDVDQFSPSRLCKMTRLLANFPKTQFCVLAMGYREGEGVVPFVDYGPGPKHEHEMNRTVAVLAELLRELGVSKSLRISVGVFKGLQWTYYNDHLVKDTFPMLRFRAKLLNETVPRVFDRTQR